MFELTPEKVEELVAASDEALDADRAARTAALRVYTGAYYRHAELDGTEPKTPVNMVYRACRSMQLHVGYRNPAFEASTDFPPMKGVAAMLGLQIDHLAQELDFRRIDRLLLLDALLGAKAIVRMGVRDAVDVATGRSRVANPGMWCLERVSLDDYVVDPTAVCREERGWEGFYHWGDVDRMAQSGLFDPAMLEHLPTTRRGELRNRASRADSLADLRDGHDDDQLVRLLTFYCYDLGGSGVTYRIIKAAGESSREFLYADEFEGPERGVFEELAFDELPDNPTALPAVATFREQHDNVNAVLAKTIRQLLLSKKVGLLPENAPDEDIDAVEQAEDGDDVRVSNPVDHAVLDRSFVQTANLPIGQLLMEIANKAAFNPDMLSGSGSDAGTATEFDGLMAQASVLTDAIVGMHDAFWERVGNNARWYLVRSPDVWHGTYDFGGGFKLPVQMTPEEREGDLEEITLKVRPFSSLHRPKAVKVQQLLQLIAQIPQLIQTEIITGGAFSSMAAIKLLAERMGEDDLDELIQDPALLARMAQKYSFLMPQLLGRGGGMGGPAVQPPSGQARTGPRRPNGGTRSIDQTRQAQAVPA